ncbi:MAG: hypothetical protein E7463_09515 [Ruminococcaceae bacterium]|nr:hypothetical protein [Oscillospiraceae bacterium]
MEKFVPYEKLSKKEKRKVDAARRTTWDVNPVTRMSENPRAYNRRKADRSWKESGAGLPFVLCG